eukprot:5367541-Prymnesium_polylepis.1
MRFTDTFGRYNADVQIRRFYQQRASPMEWPFCINPEQGGVVLQDNFYNRTSSIGWHGEG